MPRRWIFLDGQMVSGDEIFLEELSPCVLKGQGVFETMRAYQGEIFLLQEHLDRLFRGLKVLKIKFPDSGKTITRRVYETLRRSRLKNARVRLTVWKGKGRPRISVIAFPYRPYSIGKYKEGFQASVSDVRRDETSVLTRVKSIDYRFFLKAYQKAVRQGRDEAILLNRKGELVEGTRTNIFFVKKGILFTPGLKCGCLNGITRQEILRLAREKGIPCSAGAKGLPCLLNCDEAFLTNSLIGIMPLTSLEGKRIHKGEAGPVTTELTQCYKKSTPEVRQNSPCPGSGN